MLSLIVIGMSFYILSSIINITRGDFSFKYLYHPLLVLSILFKEKSFIFLFISVFSFNIASFRPFIFFNKRGLLFFRFSEFFVYHFNYVFNSSYHVLFYLFIFIVYLQYLLLFKFLCLILAYHINHIIKNVNN